MGAPLTLLLPDLVALIQSHFHPQETRVNFPGTFAQIANIKVYDDHELLRHEFHAGTRPSAEDLVSEIVFGERHRIALEISEPQPEAAEEDLFRWELVAKFEIPEDLDPEEWLDDHRGRRAWGEWTTWHDHTRRITIYPLD